jgi:hypothetical protein
MVRDFRARYFVVRHSFGCRTDGTDYWEACLASNIRGDERMDFVWFSEVPVSDWISREKAAWKDMWAGGLFTERGHNVVHYRNLLFQILAEA